MTIVYIIINFVTLNTILILHKYQKAALERDGSWGFVKLSMKCFIPTYPPFAKFAKATKSAFNMASSACQQYITKVQKGLAHPDRAWVKVFVVVKEAVSQKLNNCYCPTAVHSALWKKGKSKSNWITNVSVKTSV